MTSKTILVLAIVSVLIGATVAPVYGGGVIDIKSGSDENKINVNGNGLIPVAILGSNTFDATQVNPVSLAFGPAGAAPAHNGHIEDVNDDGFPDLVTHYRTQETGIAAGDTNAILTGETFGGDTIFGSDNISTISNENP